MSQLPITVTSFFHLRLYPTFLKQQVSIFLPIDMLRSVETYIRWKYQLLYIVAHGTLLANHPFFIKFCRQTWYPSYHETEILIKILI